MSQLADAAAEEASGRRAVRVTIGDTTALLPHGVVAKIGELLGDIAEGRSVAIAPADLPVGTQTAADVLGVSRPWLTRLLDRGDIPMHKVGTKRRLLLGDLVAYRRADDERRRRDQT